MVRINRERLIYYYFENFQGLKNIPYSLLCLCVAAGAAGWLNDFVYSGLFLALLTASILGYYFIPKLYYWPRYTYAFVNFQQAYRDRNSILPHTTSLSDRRYWLTSVLPLLLLIGAISVDIFWAMPVVVTLWVLGIWAGLVVVLAVQMKHYLIVAVVIMPLAFYPLLDSTVSHVSLAFIGLALYNFVGGLGDHFALVSILRNYRAQ